MRLTNNIRDAIVNEVVNVTTDKDKKDLDKREKLLAQQCYNQLFSKETRAAIDSLPRGFMPETSLLYLSINGMSATLKSAQPVRVPFCSKLENESLQATYRNSDQRLGGILNKELYEKFMSLHADKEAHKARTNKIRAETKSLLYSLFTYPQLEKTWPEGKKFYSKYAPKNSESQLPAILISDLNKTLGIGN